MAYGEVYVEVDASVVNGGIAPMAMVSGNPEPVDGQAVVVVWIRWRYDDSTGDGGFTGTGWYFDDPNIAGHYIAKGYSTEEEIKKWLMEDKPTDLDSFLRDWPADNKAAFLNSHMTRLDAGDCLYFTAGTPE